MLLWDCFLSDGPWGLVKMAKHILTQTPVASSGRFSCVCQRQSFRQGDGPKTTFRSTGKFLKRTQNQWFAMTPDSTYLLIFIYIFFFVFAPPPHSSKRRYFLKERNKVAIQRVNNVSLLFLSLVSILIFIPY